jgi:hypothetical protein
MCNEVKGTPGKQRAGSSHQPAKDRAPELETNPTLGELAETQIFLENLRRTGESDGSGRREAATATEERNLRNDDCENETADQPSSKR